MAGGQGGCERRIEDFVEMLKIGGGCLVSPGMGGRGVGVSR